MTYKQRGVVRGIYEVCRSIYGVRESVRQTAAGCKLTREQVCQILRLDLKYAK